MQKLSFEWKDYSLNVGKSIKLIRDEKELFDVTLVSDDHVFIGAHKVVLSAFSEFFKELIRKMPNQNPILYLGGLDSKHMNYLLDFLYMGEAHVSERDVDDFLSNAQKYKVNGLCANQINKQLNIQHVPNPILIPKKEIISDDNESTNLYEDSFSNFVDTQEAEESTNQTVDDKQNFESEPIEANKNLSENLDELLGSSPHKIDMELDEDVPSNDNNIVNEESNDNTLNYSINMSSEELSLKIKNLIDILPDSKKCQDCDYRTKNTTNIRNHVELHITNLEYKCKFCSNTHKTKNTLLSHLSRMHRDKRIDITMKKKPLESDDSNASDDIEKSVHENKEETESSEAKPMETLPENDENHITKQPDNETSDFKIVNMALDVLAAKTKEIVEKDIDRYKCKTCGFSSLYRNSIIRHAETHIEGLEYTCKFCSKTYKTQSNLYVHVSRLHKEDRN